jgi:hypothetical protein
LDLARRCKVTKMGKRPVDKLDVKNIISFLERDVLNVGDALEPGHQICLDILNYHTKRPLV